MLYVDVFTRCPALLLTAQPYTKAPSTADKNRYQRVDVALSRPVQCYTYKCAASRGSAHPPVVSQFGKEKFRVDVVLLGDVDFPGPHGDIREIDYGRHGLESRHELLHLRRSDVVQYPRPGRLQITARQSGKASDDSRYGIGGSAGKQKKNIGKDHAELSTDLAESRLIDATNFGRAIVGIGEGTFPGDC